MSIFDIYRSQRKVKQIKVYYVWTICECECNKWLSTESSLLLRQWQHNQARLKYTMYELFANKQHNQTLNQMHQIEIEEKNPFSNLITLNWGKKAHLNP